MAASLMVMLLGVCLSNLARPVASQCVRDSYASLPTAPVFPTTILDAALTPAQSTLVTGHWSQVAVMERPAAFTPVANPTQTGCPHLTGTLVDFHTLGFTHGNDVNIPANTRVLVSSCSVPAGTVYGRVSIPSTSELIFGDAVINFQARGIFVNGGKLLIGSQTCRIRNKVTITLSGSRTAQALPPADVATKGIWSVNGTVEMHGAQFFPTWTRLAKTVNAGDDLIFIQDTVNWQPGQSIVVTTSELKDSRDFNRNEERVISQVFRTSYSGVTALRVSTAFAYKHYGGRAYQSEVGLLSRTIIVQGSVLDSEPTDTDNAVCVSLGDSTYPCNNKYLTGFGAHVRIEGPSSVGRFSGVEFFRVGQTNVLGRYPLHFHQVGQSVVAGRLFARDCSVHRSYFRAFAVHGSNNVVISQNVAYDVIGHAYFLEDGIEENNRFEYNLGAHVHWLGPSQDHDNVFGAQFSFWIDEGPDLILPSDLGASVFYITNAYNEFIGNAASGGFSGYGIVNLPTPVKLNENYMGLGNFSPMARPLLMFKGNTAHSTAYWNEQVGALYVGGTLKHKTPGGILTYTAGRDLERHTCNVQPSTTWGYCQRADYAWLNFESVKVWLANRGAQHWGVRARLDKIEFHDVGMSSNVFGQVSLNNMLINCRSLEHVPTKLCPSNNCRRRDRVFFQYFFGFQWYDVGQNHIMTDVEFRNCNPNWSECMYKDNCGGASTFLMLTHSHRYVPEVMQASRNLTYTNFNPNTLVKFTVAQDAVRTVSGRLSNWLDFDGSVFPGVFPGQQLILGSAWANTWWQTHTGCLGPKNDLFICPRGQDGVASVYVSYDEALEKQVEMGSICPNGEGPCPVIGMATHFGRSLSEGLEIGQNSKITGPVIRASGGWFVKLNNGSPRLLRIKQAQIHPDDNLVLAFPYPRDTVFSIRAVAPPWCDWARVTETLVRVNSLAEVRAGWGDRYFFDTVKEVLYFRVVQRNDDCFPANTVTIPWQKQDVASLAAFSSRGITLMVMEQWRFVYEISASNCGGTGAYCAPVAGDFVPESMATQSPAMPATYAPTQPTLAPTAQPTPPCAALWAQCGSDQYTGCCLQGVCTIVNQYYKQCQPAASPTTQPPTVAATKSPSSPPTTPTATTKAPSAPPSSSSVTKAPSSPPSSPTATGAPSASSTTRAPTSNQGCAALWAQCGGQGWSGPTCCAPDATFGAAVCVFDNNWYSQCQPASSATSSPVAPSSAASTSAPSSKTSSPTSKTLAPAAAASTPTPTLQSTSQPSTRSPTGAPSTSKPTVKLPGGTRFPTRRPTRNPTRRPSRNPTKRPTRRPTLAG